MRKKLQIFVSSTYNDLIEERQAAVKAILKAGHIPAGMELFTAGDESQWNTIKRWIDESDIFLLILGGRYGSIKPNTSISYIEAEYDYAVDQKIPHLSIVISEEALRKKVKTKGQDALELENPQPYKNFKEKVLQKISSFFNDSKDIELAIHSALADFVNRYNFKGWVSAAGLIEGHQLGNAPQLYIQHSTPNKFPIEDAIKRARRTLSFQGISLMSLVNGRITELIIQKLLETGFEDISMVVLDPSAPLISSKVRGQIKHFLDIDQVGGLIRAGEKMDQRIKLYISKEFIRYSATYVDVDTDNGIIWVAFPMYGLVLQDSPTTLITSNQSQEVYNCLVQSWQNFRSRLPSPISTLKALKEYNDNLDKFNL